MAAIQPPLFIGVNGVIDAARLGLPFRDIMGEGVVGDTDLAVAQRAAGANMSVDVAAGAAWVNGDDDANAQPTYRVRNDATVNVAIAGADASKPRIDRVVARVYDSAFAGTSLTWDIEVLTGTPSTGATLVNLNGVVPLPNTCLLLANVLVPAAASSVVTADLADVRTFAAVGKGSARAAGAELAYDQVTAPFSVPVSAADVIAGTSHNYDGTPVMVEFFAPSVTPPSTAGEVVNLYLWDGATQIARLAAIENPAAAADEWPVLARLRLTPTPGSHQYHVKAGATSTTGTPTVGAGTGTGGNLAPAYLRVTKV